MDNRNYFKKSLFNLANQSDVDELDKIITYAKGLIIHNKTEGDSKETTQSLKNFNTYMKAKLGLDDTMSPYIRNRVISSYIETNPYYKDLHDKYNIEYLEARTAKDYSILAETNNILTETEANMFKEAYYSAVKYHLSVTHTPAFNNQEFNREFFETYILYMAFIRYINLKMETYFNVDTYNKYQLKNEFISNGLDYFDSFPIHYQRKLLKMLNDLIRNKGTDNVFDIILSVFGFSGINIYKYYLVKENTYATINNQYVSSINFYKSPYNKNFNIDTNRRIDFDKVTGNDPYWKSSIVDINKHNFNVVNSKYNSVDVTMEILKNTFKLANFMSLIFKLQTSGKNDNTFTFLNKNLSDSPINISNAIIALISLLMKFYGFKDKVNTNIDAINSVYGYNDIDNESIDVKNAIKEIKKLTLWNKEDLSTYEKEHLESFLNFFYMKNFNYVETYDAEKILKTFNSDPKYLGDCYDFVNRVYNYGKYNVKNVERQELYMNYFYPKLKEYLDNGEIYKFFDKVSDFFYNRKMEFELFSVGDYTYFSQILNLVINHKVLTNVFDEYVMYDMINITYPKIINEFNSYVILNFSTDETVMINFNLYKDSLSKYKELLELYNSNPTSENKSKMEKVRYETNNYLDNCLDVIFRFSNEKMTSDPINKYPVLKHFITIFLSYSYLEKNEYSVNDLVDIFKYNENVKKILENLILNTNSYDLYKEYNKIWELNFTTESIKSILVKDASDINNIQYYDTFSDYLKVNDQNLYLYVNDILTDDDTISPTDIMIERIFELSQSIESFLNMSDKLFLNNNYVGILTFVRRYVKILIKVFKAYTVELINSSTFVGFDSKLDNSIRVFDEIDKSNISFILPETIGIIETYQMTNRLFYSDRFKLEDSISFKFKGVNTNGIVLHIPKTSNLLTDNVINLQVSTELNDIPEYIKFDLYNFNNKELLSSINVQTESFAASHTYKLMNGYYNTNLQISVSAYYKNGDVKFIGSAKFTIKELVNNVNRQGIIEDFELPDNWIEGYDSFVEAYTKLKSQIGKNTFSFIHFADPHCGVSNQNYLLNSSKAMRNLMNQFDIKFVTATGDLEGGGIYAINWDFNKTLEENRDMGANNLYQYQLNDAGKVVAISSTWVAETLPDDEYEALVKSTYGDNPTVDQLRLLNTMSQSMADIIAENCTKSLEKTDQVFNEVYTKVRENIGDNYTMLVAGNHDGSSTAHSPVWNRQNASSVYRHWYSQERKIEHIYEYQTQDSNKHFGPEGSYYYIDYPLNKMRVICLDNYIVKDSENLLSDGALPYMLMHNACFGQQQYDWMINEALKFEEDGWKAIICIHSSFDGIHRECLHQLINDYNNGISGVCNYDPDIISQRKIYVGIISYSKLEKSYNGGKSLLNTSSSLNRIYRHDKWVETTNEKNLIGENNIPLYYYMNNGEQVKCYYSPLNKYFDMNGVVVDSTKVTLERLTNEDGEELFFTDDGRKEYMSGYDYKKWSKIYSQYNFENYEHRGTIIANFIGHSHPDITVPSVNDKYYNVGIKDKTTYYLTIPTLMCTSMGWYKSDTTDYKCTSFDIITIDLDNNRIYNTYFGRKSGGTYNILESDGTITPTLIYYYSYGGLSAGNWNKYSSSYLLPNEFTDLTYKDLKDANGIEWTNYKQDNSPNVSNLTNIFTNEGKYYRYIHGYREYDSEGTVITNNINPIILKTDEGTNKERKHYCYYFVTEDEVLTDDSKIIPYFQAWYDPETHSKSVDF